MSKPSKATEEQISLLNMRGVKTDYCLDRLNLASEEEYMAYGLANYRLNLQKLHSALFNTANKSNREFIEHYRSGHSSIFL